ncbi:MAG: hypothetical protein V4606_03110 [Patescibacteria group bacterium]
MCWDSHRVTLRLPTAISEKAQMALRESLQKTYWQAACAIHWVDATTLRMIARSGQFLMENLLILEGYAKTACRLITAEFKRTS